MLEEEAWMLTFADCGNSIMNSGMLDQDQDGSNCDMVSRLHPDVALY